jgi:hypothetical protein
VRLLGLELDRVEMLDCDEEVDPRELDPELRPLPLLFDDEAGGDCLRFRLACDGGAARTTTPINIRTVAVCVIFNLFIFPSHLNFLFS